MNENNFQQSDLNKELDFLQKVPAKYRTKPMFLSAIIGVLIVGIFLGSMLFGGDSGKVSGLQGVIRNPDVPAGRQRCGTVEHGRGCVLYIVNSQNREIAVKELYPLASQMTKIQTYLIETSNLRYNNVLIRPGYIAQINIKPIQ